MSINDRLGALCDRFGAGGAGSAFTTLESVWVDELARFNAANVEDVEEASDGGKDHD